MVGRCIVTYIIFFRDCCHYDHWIEACLVLSYVLGNSGYLSFLPVGPAMSCCCDKNAIYKSVVVVLVPVLGWILGSTECRFSLLVIIFVLFVSMVLDGSVAAVACIKVDFHGAAAVSAGAAASSSVGVRVVIFGVWGVIFVVVAVQIAWNATNAL